MKKIVRAFVEHPVPGQPEFRREAELLPGSDANALGQELLDEIYTNQLPGGWEVVEVPDNYEPGEGEP
jgi:hypothetical protein